MKTIIAGCRDYTLTDNDKAFLSLFNITEVVCGGAKGVDISGWHWAIENNIPVRMFPADWKAHGKAAGPLRNKQMAEYSSQLIAFWDGKSRGTRNMIETAKKLGLKVHVELTEPAKAEVEKEAAELWEFFKPKKAEGEQ